MILISAARSSTAAAICFPICFYEITFRDRQQCSGCTVARQCCRLPTGSQLAHCCSAPQWQQCCGSIASEFGKVKCLKKLGLILTVFLIFQKLQCSNQRQVLSNSRLSLKAGHVRTSKKILHYKIVQVKFKRIFLSSFLTRRTLT